MRRSITDKTRPEKLKEMIKHRQASRKITELYDHSVPHELLFQGVLAAAEAQKRARIHITAQSSLSPFIIHLNQPAPSPADLIDQGPDRHISLNLLVPESALRTVRTERMKNSAPADDLSLDTKDVRDQLAEETLLPIGAATTIHLSIPKATRTKSRPSSFRASTAIAEPAATLLAPLPVQELAPPLAPTDLVSAFDLPDMDEDEAQEEESEPLELQGLTIVQESEPQPRAFAFPAFSFALPQGWQRALGGFVLLSFAFVLPLHAMNVVQELRDAKDRVTSAGSAALADMEAGTSAALVRDASSASSSFDRANSHFSAAEETVTGLDASTRFLLSTLPVAQSNYRSGKALLAAGEALSTAGARLADGVVAVQNEINPTPTSRLSILREYVTSALPYLATAERQLDNVDTKDVPEEQQALLGQLKAQLPPVVASLNEFTEFSDMAATILGADGLKRYLVVFQNNTEIRPTGGFMGSFAELDVQDGNIVRMDVPGGGTYDLQGSLREFLAAPEPLQLLKSRWEFQDANWFPDFPTSARQMLEFYTDAGGPTVDGVIAVNASYVADLLGLLGAIDMPEYGRTITQENFLFEAQKIVELEYDKDENKPKAFIGDLAPKVLEKAMSADPEQFLSLLEALNGGLVERHVQVYFTDESLERHTLELGWGGELKRTTGDYIMVVDTNLGGGKTDGVIDEQVQMDVNIADDGTITNTVTLSRIHQGIPGALFTGVNNVDYLRLYVPAGSELVHATGFSIPDQDLFDIPDPSWKIDDDLLYSAEGETIDAESGTHVYEETGKTVFGNWIQTRPGTTSTATFTYRLPFKLDVNQSDKNLLEQFKQFIGVPATESYTLTVQKQSGVLNRSTVVHVHPPTNVNLLWSSSDLGNTAVTNETDALVSALFESAP